MAKQDEKLVELIAKLIELTQESTLTWNIVKPSSDIEQGFTNLVGSVFETKYQNKNLRIYKVEHDNTEENHMFGMYTHQPSYSVDIKLEFVDEYGNSIWSFPRITGIVDLYKTIAYEAAGVDEFINGVLEVDETT